MAAYTFLLSEDTIKVYSPDLIENAQRITARAQTSGVVYSLLFAPYPTDPTGKVIWTPEAIAGQLSYWAGIWDQNSMVPGVAGIALTQNVNANNELEDVALVSVISTSGKSTTQIELGPREWLPSVENTTLTKSFGDAVREVVQQLDQVEAGG